MTKRSKADWALAVAEHCNALKDHAVEILTVSAAVFLTVSATNNKLALKQIEGDKS